MKSKKGFTLVEMMAVIIIIGIIMIIAIPYVARIIEEQTKTEYEVHQNLIEKAVDLYTTRNQGDFREYEVGQCLILDYSELITAKLIKEDKIMCDGKIELTKENNNSYDKNLYLNCENNKEQVLSEYDLSSIPSECITLETNSSDDASLKRLAVEGYTIGPEFDPERLEYSVEVPNEVTSLKVLAEVNDKDARYRIYKNTGFVVGENTIEIKVTAANGTNRIYKIKVTRVKSDKAELLNLKASDCVFDQGFNKDRLEYTCHMTNDKSTTNVTAIASSSEAKIEGLGKHSLIVGSQTIEVTVTSEDGLHDQTYKITISRNPNSNPNLKKIAVKECELSPLFDKDTLDYSCTVDNNIVSTEVMAESEETVTRVTGEGTYTLRAGENKIIITTVAEDGVSIKEYRVNISKKPNDNTHLKALTVSNCVINFDESHTTYQCVVPYSIDAVEVNAEILVPTTTIESGLGISNLHVGENEIKVKTKAESGIYGEYTVIVTREPDTRDTLSSLEVVGYSFTEPFDPEKLEYTVNTEEAEIVIKAEATSEVAYMFGAGTHNIDWGTTDKTVMVTSQNGSIKNYVIHINNVRPTPPVINGGTGDTESTAEATISIQTTGTAPNGGGVQKYEYYMSEENVAPSDSTRPTGTTLDTVKISEEGTYYIWYRTLSNNYFRSVWSNMQLVRIVSGVYFVGTGTTFNIKNTYPDIDYTKLTADNFIAVAKSMPNLSGTDSTDGHEHLSGYLTGISLTKSYNASTGVLTIGGNTFTFLGCLDGKSITYCTDDIYKTSSVTPYVYLSTNPATTVRNLGKGTSFNVKNTYPDIDYTKLTINDNFIIGVVSSSTIYADRVTGEHKYISGQSYGFSLSPSYNASTGALSISGTGYSFKLCNDDSYLFCSDATASGNASPTVYLVPGGIK